MNKKLTFLVLLLLLTPVLATAANVGHNAEGIYGGGIFGEGNYVFPNSLNVIEDLGVGGSVDIQGSILAQGAYIGVQATIAEHAGSGTLDKGDIVSLRYAPPRTTIAGAPVYLIEQTRQRNEEDIVGIVYDSFRPLGKDNIQTGEYALIASDNSIVYAKASAENGPIYPGDKLTIAATPGHAMRADENSIITIGKALGTVTDGTKLVAIAIHIQKAGETIIVTRPEEPKPEPPKESEPEQEKKEEPKPEPEEPRQEEPTIELRSNGEIIKDDKGNTIILIE